MRQPEDRGDRVALGAIAWKPRSKRELTMETRSCSRCFAPESVRVVPLRFIRAATFLQALSTAPLAIGRPSSVEMVVHALAVGFKVIDHCLDVVALGALPTAASRSCCIAVRI